MSIRSAAAILIALLAPGCAYYNTFFHARQAYSQAEAAREQAPTENKETIGLDLYEQAMKRCAKVIVEYPGSRWVDDAILLMGKCFYARGDYLAALRKFDEILLYYEKSDLAREARFWKAKTLVALERFDEAVPAVEKFREGKKDDLRREALYLLALVEYRRENYAEAAGGFEVYLEKGGSAKDKSEVLRLLADCYRKAGESAKALVVYRDRLRDPLLDEEERLATSLDLTDVLVEEGRFEEAYRSLDDLERDTERREDSLQITLHRGKALLAEGRTDEAVTVLRSPAGETGSPAAGEIAYELGETYLDSYDNKDSAAAAFRKASTFLGTEERKAEAAAKSAALGAYLDLKTEFAAGAADSARVRFLLAEHELFSFDEPESALARYRTVSERYPRSAFAPRALAAEAYLLRREEAGVARSDSLLLALVRAYPKSPAAVELLDRLEVVPDSESLGVWIAAYEAANPEPDSAAAADSASADSGAAAAPELPIGSEGELAYAPDSAVGPLEGPPAPLRLSLRVDPTYPLLAAGESRRGGNAEVEVLVDAGGKVTEARVVRSSERIFEGPALAAAYQCRYFPETTEGTRTANLRFEFRPDPP
jgi:TonB family protein